ncbi:MAG: Fur family transcriptional regulator [Candidatus Aminicenantes bacterium]|jgi:Fur family peroxide stress response transcriptional regulator
MMNPDNPHLFKRLREHGVRPTAARRLVLALLNEKNDHLSTEGIITALRDNGFTVSVATLYQNLNKLVEVGLLARIKGPDDLMRFDANLAPHHHLVCTKCGKIVDVRNNEEQLLQKSPLDYQTGATLSEWHIDYIKIEFNGTCPDCRK